MRFIAVIEGCAAIEGIRVALRAAVATGARRVHRASSRHASGLRAIHARRRGETRGSPPQGRGREERGADRREVLGVRSPKDGISAAVSFVQLASDFVRDGRTPLDLPEEVWSAHGYPTTEQTSTSAQEISQIEESLNALRNAPPHQTAGRNVTLRRGRP